MILSVITIYPDDTTLESKHQQKQQQELASELESDLLNTVRWDWKWFSFGLSINHGAIDVEKDWSIL